MDSLLLAIIVIGVVLISMAGAALYLFYDWHKRSILRIEEERAYLARRQAALSQREVEEERDRLGSERRDRRYRRLVRNKERLRSIVSTESADEETPISDLKRNQE